MNSRCFTSVGQDAEALRLVREDTFDNAALRPLLELPAQNWTCRTGRHCGRSGHSCIFPKPDAQVFGILATFALSSCSFRAAPSDMQKLNIDEGNRVDIRFRHGMVFGFAHGDSTLRPGVVAMTYGYGATSNGDYDPRPDGSNINELISWENDPDPFMVCQE